MKTFTAPRSKVIKQAWYHPRTLIMSVEFKNKTGYLYVGVPQPVFTKFAKAKSKGRFFTANIRDIYPSQKDVFASSK